MVIADPASGLRAVVHFGHKDAIDQIDGFITEIPEDMDIMARYRNNLKLPMKKRKGLKELALSDLLPLCSKVTLPNFKKLIEKQKVKNLSLLGEIGGSWTNELVVDGRIEWNKSVKRFAYLLVKDPLPSDFRFREDLLWLRYGHILHAQKWKLRLEAGYRKERKTREKLNNLRNKAM